MYCSLLRPDLMCYASQLSKVMSRPSAANGVCSESVAVSAWTYDHVITYRPVDCDGFAERDSSLCSFSGSDWARAIDSMRSYGCHLIMMEGGAVSWKSSSHKSVMLSTTAAEYYEASESCRQIAFIRSIMEDIYKCNLDHTPLLVDTRAAMCMSNQYHEGCNVTRTRILEYFKRQQTDLSIKDSEGCLPLFHLCFQELQINCLLP
jgi:hypothetical protein